MKKYYTPIAGFELKNQYRKFRIASRCENWDPSLLLTIIKTFRPFKIIEPVPIFSQKNPGIACPSLKKRE